MKILALLLLAGGLTAGALVWQTNTRTTSGTTGGGDVDTHATDAATCAAQAHAFNDYPLVWAGPSVLGYPLTWCAHTMTKTRRDEQGRVSHPGGDSWGFGYGTCETPEGKESCPIPITIDIDPCALLVDGRIIPKGGQTVHNMIVRGAQANIYDDGVLTLEQSPQIISIYAPPKSYHGQGMDVYAAERVANAVTIANALVPANGLAEALSHGAPLTAAFAQRTDILCASSSGAATMPTTP
jgi:hypothetical protein